MLDRMVGVAESYKIFLEALIASKKILPSQDDILQKYREDNKISSSQHALVLQRLGLTLSQFDAMRSKVRLASRLHTRD